MRAFQRIVVSLCGAWDPSLPIARGHAPGRWGCWTSPIFAMPRPPPGNLAAQAARARVVGLYLDGRPGDVEIAALAAIEAADTIVLTSEFADQLASLIGQCRPIARQLGLVITTAEEAKLASGLPIDFLIAKGNEAGGRVGGDITLPLVEKLVAESELPIIAWGAHRPEVAAQCFLAGTCGAVLDWQLALASLLCQRAFAADCSRWRPTRPRLWRWGRNTRSVSSTDCPRRVVNDSNIWPRKSRPTTRGPTTPGTRRSVCC